MHEQFYIYLPTILFFLRIIVVVWIYQELKSIYWNIRIRKLSTQTGLNYAKHKRKSLFKIENAFMVGNKNGRYIEVRRHNPYSKISIINLLFKSSDFKISYSVSVECNHANTNYRIVKSNNTIYNYNEIIRTKDTAFNDFYHVLGARKPIFYEVINSEFIKFLKAHCYNITGEVILENNYLTITDRGKLASWGENLIFMIDVATQAAEKVEKPYLRPANSLARNKAI